MRFSKCAPEYYSTRLPDIEMLNKGHYYLSMLERFVETTQDMPESILKLYLVRAEYRYYRWVSARGHEAYIAPPLDVAFFWQTHMLRPVLFEKDCARHFKGELPQKSEEYEFPTLKYMHVPLQEIHENQGKISFETLQSWRDLMGKDEPYHLTPTRLIESCSNSCAKISCIICFIQMNVGWNDFVEWRLDHTVALACHRCGGRFTSKHVGKANLLNDIGPHHEGYLHHFAEYFKLPPGALQEIKRLPFNSGTPKTNKEASYIFACGSGIAGVIDALFVEFVDFVHSTYLCHPYKASFDLLYAVARQYKFAYKITKLAPLNNQNDIETAFEEFDEFINLVASNRDLVAVPTLKADLIWHLNMVHALGYRVATTQVLGKVLDHNDDIPQDELTQHVSNTQRKSRVLRQEETKKKNLFGVLNIKKRKQEAALREKGKGINDLLKFNNSDQIMKEKFGHLMHSEMGFAGTSTCGSIERLDCWERSEKPASKEKKAFGHDPHPKTYTKVFYSTGKPPYVPPEILAQIPYNSNVNTNRSFLASIDALPPDTSEEPFDWEKVSVAWANIFGLTADEEDAVNFRTINQQGNLGASCGVLTLHDERPSPPNSTSPVREKHQRETIKLMGRS
ncbi:hypothetical protein MBANPS3_000183 [Mucor bainieri]